MVFFSGIVALLLIWPFHPGRYVAPLVPLLVLFLFRGMAGTEHWLKTVAADYRFKGVLAKLPWIPVALLLMLNGVWLSSYLLIFDEQTTRGGYGSRAPYGWAGFEESFAWIRRSTRPVLGWGRPTIRCISSTPAGKRYVPHCIAPPLFLSLRRGQAQRWSGR